jgi:cytoskeletal protein CcmA (bactofilin family)
MPHLEITENDSHGDDINGPEQSVPASVVSRGMTLTGNVMSQGVIKIEGTIRGEVRASHVWIRPDGSVEGAIIANRATVEGYMNGSVTANHIHLGDSARVDGDLCSENLKIIKGAKLLGRINPKQSSSSGLVATQTRSRSILSLPTPALPLLKPPTSIANGKLQLAEPAVMKDQVRLNLQRRLAALAYIR